MKIIFEYDTAPNQRRKVTVETNSEEICEVLDDIAGALVAYGFHQQSVRNGFINKAEEYMEETSNVVDKIT